ncbi:MAG: hypothetical protein M0009_00750 [Deltaproteobacteria bacterium]|nr:hypothetical protein [Deltaproteobacteria bacterium]
MRWFLVLILFLASVRPSSGGELFAFYGSTSEPGGRQDSFAYQVEYREGLGENAAISVSYLNEGHMPNHHRDGLAPLTLWGRVNLLNRRLSLAVGAGPYLYADTTQTPQGVAKNEHGLGGLLGASATWYLGSRLLFQARVNWVMTKDSIDTVTGLAGIGYQLDAPATPGPLVKPPSQREKTTNNELTLFLGQTVVNNPGNPKSIASCVEYRRGLFPYLDVTAAWLNEGDNELIRRNGAITQLWLVRDFLDDHLTLGGGLGAYLAIDSRGGLYPDEGGSAFASGIMSVTASLRNFSFNPDLTIRFVMNRILTNYSKDTDIFLFGLGYRF